MAKSTNETTNTSATDSDATKPNSSYYQMCMQDMRDIEEMRTKLAGLELEPLFTIETTDRYKSHCPSLTFPEWLVVLFEIDLGDEHDHDDLDGWLWDIFYDSPLGGELDQSSTKLETLKPEEVEFARLVADKIIDEEDGGYDNFRATIGILSVTADECVFRDDLTVEDLWKLVSVEEVGETYNVYWQFNGGSTTLVSLAQSPDGSLAVTNDIRKFNARLHPKGEDLEAFLIRNSIAEVQAVMKHKLEMAV